MISSNFPALSLHFHQSKTVTLCSPDQKFTKQGIRMKKLEDRRQTRSRNMDKQSMDWRDSRARARGCWSCTMGHSKTIFWRSQRDDTCKPNCLFHQYYSIIINFILYYILKKNNIKYKKPKPMPRSIQREFSTYI